ncbi:MAG TPA: hypothetical protein VJR30_03040 [Bradyrhizobium sp.]|nr:hypothetical protein [Bradyrhizobium sp.]
MGTIELQIDSSHCRAICDEIGDRLRIMLDREATALPPRLQMLMQQLAEQDFVLAPSIAPSIVPSIGDMIGQAEPTQDISESMLAA